MNEMIHLLSNFLLGEMSPFSKPHRYLSLRFMANMGAFFLLAFGYVLGCRALYHYLEPQWGDVYALIGIGLMLVITSLFLFLIGWLLKPKDPPLKEFIANVEKTLGEIPYNEHLKKLISNVPVKAVAAFVAAIIATSYFKKTRK